MLAQLLTSVRLAPKEDSLDPHSETRHSTATTFADSPQTHDQAKLLPSAQPSYPRESTVYDRMSDADVSPVALSTPVDMGRLAGHISDDNVRRL